jgi:hypothetical protein
LLVFLYYPQIKADKTTKNGQLYFVKWFGINNLGCTWEPSTHFVGTAAELKLQQYIESKEEEARKSEKRREDILAGKLVVTGKSSEEPVAVEPTTVAIPPTAPTAPTTSTTHKAQNQSNRSRQNASIVWDHFNGGPGNKEKWYWDNSTTPASKRSICSICNTHVSASSTTNLRTHMQSAHKDYVIKELKANETLEVGKCVTLKSLKEDFGAVEKYSGSFKQELDEQFVKWCCKKRRGLSIGETDRELKSWMLQATRGRYQPPARKTAVDILLTMRVKADNTTKKLMLKLRADSVLPSISGTR